MATRIMRIATIGILVAGLAAAVMLQIVAAGEQGVSVAVKGESWDADSSGFAFFGGLSKEEEVATSARPGSRISLDGRADKFAIAGPGPGFELSFTTAKPSFRLIVEGDRFPRFITQPIAVPEGGGEIDVGPISAPRAEGPEHTWPLAMAADGLGYGSALEMLADNKAAIRILVWSSGADGVPPLANDTMIAVKQADAEVIPFTMDAQNTFFQMTGPRLGAFLVIVPFATGETTDKEILVSVTDTVTEPSWDPPRPWIYDPITVIVRNGFATEADAEIKID